MPDFNHGPRLVKCELRYGLKPVFPILSGLALLIAPDHPPNAAKGEWFTPLIALGQVFESQSTRAPVERSSTRFEPGRITAPTLSWTVDCVLSTASGPMSPQSMESAQRPDTNRPRESPTSLFNWSGGPSFEICL